MAENPRFRMISEKKRRQIKEKMEALSIKEADITERFIRSRGRGGQNLNKVSTCVYLKHRPTGLEVKCDRGRSQALNRFLARRLLVDKIQGIKDAVLSERQKRIEKIRRQKRKRSRRSKEKMLEQKKKQSVKKAFRRKVDPE